MDSGRIQGFDGLRAISFLLVFASHKVPLSHPDAFGDVGVWTFFVLSGFLITRILAQAREDAEAGRTTASWGLARFYLRRTARIFPVYYALLGVALLISLAVPIDHFWAAEKLAYASYTTNILIAYRDAWPGDFGHLWSLAVEEQFYLLFAPLALLTPRRRTALLCLAFIAVALVTKVAMELGGASSTAIDVNSVINFGLLGLGGLVGLAAGVRRLPSWLVGGPAQAATLVALVAIPAIFGAWRETWLVYAKVIGLLAALLVFQIAAAQKTFLVAILEAAPLRLLGRISYATYLFHHFIHFSTIATALGLGSLAATPWPVKASAELAITIALATASWVVLERPLLRLGARLTARAPFAPQSRAPRPTEA